MNHSFANDFSGPVNQSAIVVETKGNSDLMLKEVKMGMDSIESVTEQPPKLE